MKKYEMIVISIKKQIASGDLREGSKLPSIENGARLFHCSKGTVQRAYNQLLDEHIIYVKKHSGFYVAKAIDLSAIPEDTYNLTTGNTFVNYFPLDKAQTSLVQALENYQYQSLNYELQGVPSLLQAIEKHLYNRNIFTSTDAIFVTQGIHQTFTSLCNLYLNEGDFVLVENPSYSYTVQFLQKHHIPVKLIERTQDGLSLTQLEVLFKSNHIKFFYTIPRNHNPLGTHLNKKQIQAIAALAKKYNVIIIEDDYFSEGGFNSDYQTIFENARDNCIYLSSFTKFIPYLRIGYMITPTLLTKDIRDMIQNYYVDAYFAPAMISQATLEIVLKSNLLHQFTPFFHRNLVEKKMVLNKLTSNWNPNVIQHIPSNEGFYSIMILDTSITIDTLKTELAKKNILVTSTKQAFFDKNHPYINSIRISVARINVEDLPYILDIIYQTACDLYQRKKL
ncbi:PLP-dependent aminotransferase family protein [Vagococcus sp. DIV0080]|uniref:PLP-dependent aminotransferase family protein n=1 Tax=Candidatus Vagococcus giribetii TaxID=2230876 RepID=A0ABS3HQV4_9ENTE|nr:PLP-dependent aminotransferase family protein [Vagococcus sp. DIV0080]MBO0476006.1 PLP-dependent aminotransferase family protein [Vagococcus sp. DIV0080]